MLELPYRGKSLSMVVLLPKRADGLPALEKQLTLANLNKWIDSMQESHVDIYLPKFKLETFYSLPSVLATMGMPAAFQPGGFTGMSDAPEAKRLALSEIVHKAFVEMDEEGVVFHYGSCALSDRTAKFHPVHIQSNEEVVHDARAGKTQRLAR